MRKSQLIMGTGVTIDIPAADTDEIFQTAFDRLHAIDQKFSTYKKDSEVSRFARGEIAEDEADEGLREIIKACKQSEKDTGGLFSAWAGGHFDPSGYVKGWAIAEAVKVIKEAGFDTFCISIGGDIQAGGDKDWLVGIQDPTDNLNIIARLNIRGLAIATSGNYARGQHIIDPKTGKPADSIASVSVVGPDIVRADILATAAFVAGEGALDFIKNRVPDYEILVIRKNGSQASSPGFAGYLA